MINLEFDPFRHLKKVSISLLEWGKRLSLRKINAILDFLLSSAVGDACVFI